MIIIQLIILTACQTVSNQHKNNLRQTYDLDTLYANQSIIGTTPIKPVWSSEGNELLFLWNDEGYTFRDVWSYSIITGKKQQLTHHINEVSDEQKHAGGLPGISEVVWLNDKPTEFAYVLNGQMYVKNKKNSAQIVESNKTSIRNLSVSPNGKSLAFVAQGSLWVRSTDRSNFGQSRLLLERDHEKSYVESFVWSKDSEKLVYKLTDNSPLPERDIYFDANTKPQKYQVMRAFPGEPTALFQLGLVSLDGQQKQLFKRSNEADYIWDYGLSADGQSIFINSSDLLVKNHTVKVYDVASGASEAFYHEFDAKHLRPDWQVAWAPNDDGLIILTDKDGYLHLYHQKSAHSKPEALTQGEWEIASFTVDHSTHSVYFTANKSYLSERQIYRVNLSDKQISRISPSDSGTHQFSLSNTGYAVTSFSSDDKPLELYVIDLKDLQTTQVTHSPQPNFHQLSWADISYIEFKSHLDGTNLVGRLSMPADYDPKIKYPLIVGSVYSDSVRNQYGGRTSHPTWGLDQYLVSQGYIILNVNVRGSWGQGRIHNQGLRHSYGVIDIEDLHSGVQYLINEGYVDADRVGIWGSSYGGLMTMMSLFKKPGVYAAGIAGAPATNVAHAYPGQMWVMGEPTGSDQPERYQQQSPLYHTNGLEDPLMIIHGSKDPVVLYSDTIAVVEKLIE
ncbi:MAG: prolyl oligopeptidase family serine peptidase, partial [Marinicella sp.]